MQKQEKQNEGLYLLSMNNIEDSNKNQILILPWGQILATKGSMILAEKILSDSWSLKPAK